MRSSVNGYIVSDDDAEFYRFYGMSVCSPADIRNAIATCPNGEELILEINSGGGDVFAGYEIYSVLRNAKCKTIAEIQSLAASAASTIMLGCDLVKCSPVAQIMIHLPIVNGNGDKFALEHDIKILESLTQGILNAYELKCKGKKTRNELLAMMEKSTWFDADSAKAAGLIDEIIDGEKGTDAAMNVYVNAVSGLPNISKLRQMYLEQKAKAETSTDECAKDERAKMENLLQIEMLNI